MKPEVQVHLGRRVSTLRKAREWTQEELAERCGFTVKFISAIERGVVNVPLVTLAAIAKGLEVSVSELTLAIDGALPREVRSLERLLAGRGRKAQTGIARVLAAMQALLDDSREKDPDET